eukprot:scaffold8732_cov39-Tisochrysis_lutea.AAC.6
MGKSAPLSTQRYDAPNHVLLSRRAPRAGALKRTRRLLAQWREVHVHGLGAAVAPAIQLAAQLVLESNGKLAAWTTTSTEMLIDRPDIEDDAHDDGLLGCPDDESGWDELGDSAPEEDRPRIRFNSAVHIRLTSATT